MGLLFTNATHDVEWSSSEWSRDDTPIGIAVAINSARKCLNLKNCQPASNAVRTDVREWTVGCFRGGEVRVVHREVVQHQMGTETEGAHHVGACWSHRRHV